MIERFFKNELGLKRYRRFKRRKSAVISVWLFLSMLLLTFCAPLIANNRPLLLRYQNHWYFPILKSYDAAKDFQQKDELYVNYHALGLSKGDFALWPLIRWTPFESNEKVDTYPSPPTWENIFGTDESGRDVLTRLLYGFYYSIVYAISVWLLSFIAGIVLGGLMGFFGGTFDILMQRLIEIFSTIPYLLLLLILISIFTPNLYWLVIITSIFGWIGISYLVRAEFLKNRKREYVEAARALGASNGRIIFKHILPNSLTPVITSSPFTISGHILGLAMLDFLGLGLPIPTPSWGELLAQAQRNFTISWWLALFPFLAFVITLTLLNLIGEGARDAMDPNLT